MHDIYLRNAGPVAVDPVTDRIYVAVADSLSVVDGATNTLIATVPFTGPVDRADDELVVDSATNTIYVEDREGLVVVDGSTDTVTRVLSGLQCGLALDESTNRIFCVTGPTIEVIDGSTDDVSATIKLPIYPGGPIAFDAATNTAYVATSVGMDVVDTANDTVTATEVLQPATFVSLVVDDTTGYVFASTAQEIEVLDGNTCDASQTVDCSAVTTFPQRAGRMAVDPGTATVYLTNYLVNTVSVLDEGTMTVVATFPTDYGPAFLAVDSADHALYVSNQVSSTESVVDGTTCNGTDPGGCPNGPPSAPAGTNAFAVAVDPTTNDVWVANGTSPGTVTEIDGTSCDATDDTGCATDHATVTVGDDPSALAVDPRTSMLYVANWSSGTVSVIDETTATVVATIPVGQDPRALAVDSSSDTLYVADLSGVLAVVDTATNSLVDTVTLSAGLQDVGVDTATGTLYVLMQTGIAVLDASKCDAASTTGCSQPLATATVGPQPGRLAIDQTRDLLYVTDEELTALVLVDGTRCNIDDISGCVPSRLDTIGEDPPAAVPGALAVDPARDSVYVTQQDPRIPPYGPFSLGGSVTLPLTAPPGGVAFDASNDTVYVSEDPFSGPGFVAAFAGGGPWPPGTPTLSTARATEGSVSMSWSAPAVDGTPVTSYVVQVSHPDGETVATESVPADQMQATLGGLSDGTYYYVSVAAMSTAGMSMWSPVVGLTPPGIPGQITNVYATAGTGQVSLAWQPPYDNGWPITSYLVTPWIGGTPQPSQRVVCPCRNGDILTTITGLSNGTTYTFTAAATNAQGTSPPSPPSSAATPFVPTTTTLDVSAATISFGQDQRETFSVDVRASGGTPTGQVDVVWDYPPAVCVVTLVDGSGKCSPSAYGLMPGSDVITAQYYGGVGFGGSQSMWTTVDVTRAATTTTVSLSSGTATFGREGREKISVTVGSSYEYEGDAPTGKVTVAAGSATLCTVALVDGTGQCTPGAGRLPAGKHRIVAKYPGDSLYAPSASAAASLTVVPDPTATTLSESTTTVTYGHESVEHFSVHVGAGSGWTPYGAVTIRTGPVVLCRIILSSAKGACSPAEKALPPNRYEIEAVFAGNADFAPSTSAASRMTVRS